MPFKAPEVVRCPKCERPVYAAEEKLAGGHKWHKACFKCGMCNKLLDSTNCAEHDRQLYCKTCHGRRFGPKGVGFGAGAGALSMDTGEKFGNTEYQENGFSSAVKTSNVIIAPKGEGCPRCGGYVYHADQVFSKERAWHKGCFKCGACQRFLDSKIACDGPDNNVYCNGCYRKKFGLKGYGFGQGGPALISGNEYESTANTPMTSKFIDTTTIPARHPGEGCPRCRGQVFHAEQMFSKGNVYHKRCFSCKNCKRPLDSVLCCDAPDGDIYCKGCYGKIFGAKGYGFAGGSGFLQCGDFEASVADRPHLVSNTSKIRGPAGDKDGCPRCGGLVFHAERMLSKKNVFHKTCFTCFDCNRPLDSTQCNDSPDGEIFCRLCYGKNFGPKGYGFGGSGSMPALITGDIGEREEGRIQTEFLPTKASAGGFLNERSCLRCGHEVYEAEKLIAADRSWHKRCFTCADCGRHLDSTTVNDGPDGDIYCQTDYAAKFGMQGYGYGGGAGTLHSDGGISRNVQIATETAYILP